MLRVVLNRIQCPQVGEEADEKLNHFIQKEPIEALKILSQLHTALKELIEKLQKEQTGEKKSQCRTSDLCAVSKSKDKEKVSSNKLVVKSNVEQHQSDLIQIKANKSEVDRRIAAFIEKKQKEVDDINIREFCSLFHSEDAHTTCARTDAVFVPRANSKSHVKVTRVLNEYGPQTRILENPREVFCKREEDRVPIKQEAPSESAEGNHLRKPLSAGLQERLQNLEDHLQINKREKDVFKRVKLLEEKVLHLESISPEYFSSMPHQAKRRRTHAGDLGNIQTFEQNSSMSEIEQKIQQLKQRLLMKKTIKEEPCA